MKNHQTFKILTMPITKNIKLNVLPVKVQGEFKLRGCLKSYGCCIKYFLPHPNPPLGKGRELDFYCFPPLQGGTKGGSNVMKITEYHFSNILLWFTQIIQMSKMPRNRFLLKSKLIIKFRFRRGKAKAKPLPINI
jgi:hypothetical protein